VHELVASALLYFLRQSQSSIAMGGLTDVSESLFFALEE
jgi:hypothetical protein